MGILFYGSGEFGLPTLRHLHEQAEVLAVVTQPDKPAGRHQQLTPTPIGAYAQQVGLTVLKTPDANAPSVIEQIQSFAAKAAVVIAFGQKLSPELIAASASNREQRVINLHASLLPKYRGAAPINWAILQGDQDAGVSVISLAQKMDAGLVYATQATPIGETETAGELHDRLALLGPTLIRQVLADLLADRAVGHVQDESQACRAPKLSKADAWVDFSQSAMMVCRRVHGLTPWPGVKAIWHSQATGKPQAILLRRLQPMPCHVHRASPGTLLDDQGCLAVGQGAVRILELQVPGGRLMALSEFIRGRSMRHGDSLVSTPDEAAQ